MSIEQLQSKILPNEDEPAPAESLDEQQDARSKFMGALEDEISALESSGRITTERAAEKRELGALIEYGFCDDPAHDARKFALAGVAEQDEFIDLIETKAAERELEYVEELTEDSPVADFVAVTETAKLGFGERLQDSSITEEERIDIVKSILTTARVRKYFLSIADRLKGGETIEGIIADERTRLEELKKDIGQDIEMTRETTLRLAEVAVKAVRAKEGAGDDYVQ